MTTSDIALIVLGLRRALFITRVVYKDDPVMAEEAATAVASTADMLCRVLRVNVDDFNEEWFYGAFWEPLNKHEQQELVAEVEFGSSLFTRPEVG